MITPKQLAKSGTEHAEQTALFAWCAVAHLYGFAIADSWAEGLSDLSEFKGKVLKPLIPELKWFHAVPNGGSRGDNAQSRAIRGGQLKAEGVKVGVSDCCLPVRRGGCSGLYIEMKKKGGKPSPEQLEFGAFVQSQGFGFAICYSWREAADVLIQYLNS